MDYRIAVPGRITAWKIPGRDWIKFQRWKFYDVNLPVGWAAAKELPPINVLLSDHVVGNLLDLHMKGKLAAKTLGRRWPADFTSNGCVRLTRIHSGDPYIVEDTHRIGIFADTYPLHGRYQFAYAKYIREGKCVTYYMRRKMEKLSSRGTWWKLGPELRFEPTTTIDVVIMKQLLAIIGIDQTARDRNTSTPNMQIATITEGAKPGTESSSNATCKNKKRQLEQLITHQTDSPRKRQVVDLVSPTGHGGGSAKRFSHERSDQDSETLELSTEKRLHNVQPEVTPYLDASKVGINKDKNRGSCSRAPSATDSNIIVETSQPKIGYVSSFTPLSSDPKSQYPHRESESSSKQREGFESAVSESGHQSILQPEKETWPMDFGNVHADRKIRVQPTRLSTVGTNDASRDKSTSNEENNANHLHSWIESGSMARYLFSERPRATTDPSLPCSNCGNADEIRRIANDAEANADTRTLLDYIETLKYSLEYLHNNQAAMLQFNHSATDRIAKAQSEYYENKAAFLESADRLRDIVRVSQSLNLANNAELNNDGLGDIDMRYSRRVSVGRFQPSPQPCHLQRTSMPRAMETQSTEPLDQQRQTETNIALADKNKQNAASAPADSPSEVRASATNIRNQPTEDKVLSPQTISREVEEAEERAASVLPILQDALPINASRVRHVHGDHSNDREGSIETVFFECET